MNQENAHDTRLVTGASEALPPCLWRFGTRVACLLPRALAADAAKPFLQVDGFQRKLRASGEVRSPATTARAPQSLHIFDLGEKSSEAATEAVFCRAVSAEASLDAPDHSAACPIVAGDGRTLAGFLRALGPDAPLSSALLDLAEPLDVEGKMQLLAELALHRDTAGACQPMLEKLFAPAYHAPARHSLALRLRAETPIAGKLPAWLQQPSDPAPDRNAPTPASAIFVEQDVRYLQALGAGDEAIRRFAEALRARPLSRPELGLLLRHCAPRHSKWWLHHLLLDGWLGPEQVADALAAHALGYHAAADRPWRELLLQIACHVDPAAQLPALAAGWMAAANGDLSLARTYFRRITRCHAGESSVSPWPSRGLTPWPHYPPDANQSLPRSRKWPRITVVTPSLNQGQYLEETILSVLHQGYPNLQYIIVDGGSTDGSRSILERYRHRIDTLIIEPDEGQSQALNKGLRLADGELLAWLNSDDMYGPGALFAAAEAYLETDADVLAGICLAHTEHKFGTINKPAATSSEFTVDELSRIFERWLQGAFFYQPEVFFTKKLFDEVGPLDESLHLAMDYDLWLRFARNNAKLSVVDWPMAFFRCHPGQKTLLPLPPLQEQALIRTRYVATETNEADAARLRNRMNAWHGAGVVGVAATGVAFDEETSALLRHTFGPGLRFVSKNPEDADILLFRPAGPDHWKDQIGQLRRSTEQFAMGWLDGLPADPFDAFAAAGLLDLIVADDESAFAFLRQPGVLFASELTKTTKPAPPTPTASATGHRTRLMPPLSI